MNTSPDKFTATLTAYITDTRTDLEGLKNSESPVSKVTMCASDMSEFWIKVGTAQVTLTLSDEKEVLASMVAVIDSQIQQTYAEAEATVTDLKRKKEQLLAISYDAPEEGF